MELLAELCEACGVSGREERLRAIVRRELAPLVDELRVDVLGNLIGMRRGTGSRSLAVMAHLDEIGFLSTEVDDDGFIHLAPIGGHDPRNMTAQRVTVCGKRDLLGILYPGIRPHHLLSEHESRQPPGIHDYFVDVGLPVDQVRELVPVGSPIGYQRSFAEVGDGVTCKSLDNRVALYVMIEAVRRAARGEFTLFAVATVQEEVGCRGSATAAFGLKPDVGLAIDVTVAADIPRVDKFQRVTCQGAGCAIKIMDSNSISHPRVVEALQALAVRGEIPHQLEVLPRGGTDAGPMQRAQTGVAVGTISIPTRYIHTSVEMARKSDIDAAIRLLAAFMEAGHEFDLELR